MASSASKWWPDSVSRFQSHLGTNGSVVTLCLAMQVEGLLAAPQQQEASMQFPSPGAMAQASRPSQVLPCSEPCCMSLLQIRLAAPCLQKVQRVGLRLLPQLSMSQLSMQQALHSPSGKHSLPAALLSPNSKYSRVAALHSPSSKPFIQLHYFLPVTLLSPSIKHTCGQQDHLR